MIKSASFGQNEYARIALGIDKCNHIEINDFVKIAWINGLNVFIYRQSAKTSSYENVNVVTKKISLFVGADECPFMLVYMNKLDFGRPPKNSTSISLLFYSGFNFWAFYLPGLRVKGMSLSWHTIKPVIPELRISELWNTEHRRNSGTLTKHWNAGRIPEHWRNNRKLAGEPEYHEIVEHEKSSGITEQQNNAKIYYQHRTATYWADNIKSKQESSFNKEDFHGEVKPGQETVSM